MLEALCGSKNVQRILLFLFVNGRCYGTQLHRNLKTPLTPLQNALQRLEKGGVITSDYEGKTRLYRFNPAYPLLHELEELLKKAYTLLPAQKKLDYYLVKEEGKLSSSEMGQSVQTLFSFWEKLKGVKHLSFLAKTKSKEATGWEGKGKGEVIVTQENAHCLLFHEKGNWKGKEGAETGFSNLFRWTLDRQTGVISLEHLRRGIDHPVFLFHLAPNGPHSLTSVDSHLCGGDTYFGQIRFDQHTLQLHWRVIGPKKNEEIDYYYT